MSDVNPNKVTERIRFGAKIRDLRRRRHWSQGELAKQLGISQPTLSEIERGLLPLSAERLLRVLRIFNVGFEHFEAAPERSSPIQNALARHGARHLVEDGSLVPAAFDEPGEVIFEVLRNPGSPRHLTALGPVWVANINAIALPSLASRLTNIGRGGRLGWLLECVRKALTEFEPERASDKRDVRRAQLALDLFLASDLVQPPTKTAPFDLLDSDIRSQKTAEKVLAEASDEAKRWRIVTRLRTDDFIEALRAARETR
jgi:transcriptional regulator with XRE-family HTH domain